MPGIFDGTHGFRIEEVGPNQVRFTNYESFKASRRQIEELYNAGRRTIVVQTDITRADGKVATRTTQTQAVLSPLAEA